MIPGEEKAQATAERKTREQEIVGNFRVQISQQAQGLGNQDVVKCCQTVKMKVSADASRSKITKE